MPVLDTSLRVTRRPSAQQWVETMDDGINEFLDTRSCARIRFAQRWDVYGVRYAYALRSRGQLWTAGRASKPASPRGMCCARSQVSCFVLRAAATVIVLSVAFTELVRGQLSAHAAQACGGFWKGATHLLAIVCTEGAQLDGWLVTT